ASAATVTERKPPAPDHAEAGGRLPPSNRVSLCGSARNAEDRQHDREIADIDIAIVVDVGAECAAGQAELAQQDREVADVAVVVTVEIARAPAARRHVARTGQRDAIRPAG